MLDYEYINVLADILLDETCSEKERKLRFELVKKIQGRAQYYLERGFLPQVVEAFFCRKNGRYIKSVYAKRCGTFSETKHAASAVWRYYDTEPPILF